ncbi:LPD29 domain-containing protein [Achromobacter insuavis]|uniref:LPD29 domain-containing protein n=1 Tax=Achromobacter insuavis TaxID=1287735 RepID=UPI001F137CDE|nr:LPD29 domain-containing protein [Achromobacter insuavis]
METIIQKSGRTPQQRAAQHAHQLLARVAGNARQTTTQRAMDAMAGRLLAAQEYSHLRPLHNEGTLAFVQNVRRDLVSRFPSARFFVYVARPGCLRVGWTDGPTVYQVQHVVSKFKLQAGSHRNEFHAVFGGAADIALARSHSVGMRCRAAALAFAAHERVLIGVKRPNADDLASGASVLDRPIEVMQLTVGELIDAVAEGLSCP